MPYGRASAFAILASFSFLALPAVSQSVISTHSGVIHFFEGAVYIGDQPLESHPGRFPSMPQGAELRTAEGRAEVLLTPGVFIRVGARSTIRMVFLKPTLRHSCRIAGRVSNRRFGRAGRGYIRDLAVQELEARTPPSRAFTESIPIRRASRFSKGRRKCPQARRRTHNWSARVWMCRSLLRLCRPDQPSLLMMH